MKKPITIREHDFIPSDEKGIPNNLKVSAGGFGRAPIHLGLDVDRKASYYIGADWLTDEIVDPENDIPLVVKPKFDDIDYITLFSSTLNLTDDEARLYFDNSFGIDFNKPVIAASGMNSILSPFLLTVFTKAVERVIQQGLRKGYVAKEENLECRMRGHLLLSQHIQKNVITGMNHRLFCHYSEYCYDIPENRILKKALIFSDHYLSSHKLLGTELSNHVKSALAEFGQVGNEIDSLGIQGYKLNKLFKEYSRAIELARIVLQNFDFSLSSTSLEQNAVPVFWIDMSRLFELHVLSVLRAAYGNNIDFQVAGYHRKQVADYLKTDEKIIIDAKYKDYKNNSISTDDIRELSGNARDLTLRKHMTIDETNRDLLDCVIIYSNPDAPIPSLATRFLDTPQIESVRGFINFYKLGMFLPRLKNKETS